MTETHGAAARSPQRQARGRPRVRDAGSSTVDGMAEQQHTILAAVREDGSEVVHRTAFERARNDGARLILYDLDASPTPLESPLPTNWSAEGTEDQFGTLLGPNDLEAAGRSGLAEAVRRARDAGVDAGAWLPESDDADDLREYAARVRADVVLVADADGELVEGLDLPTEVVRG